MIRLRRFAASAFAKAPADRSAGQVRLRRFAASAFAKAPADGSAGQVRLALLVLALSASVAVSASSLQATDGITVSAGVDRPAIWIADRLTYTVEIVCPRGVDILVGDLDRSKLKLTALDVVSADSSRREDGGVTRYLFEYVLTTYRVDVATPTIGSFPVRYYLTRTGQRPEEAAPAGSVVVPAVAVAFRSLLPDDQPIYDVRDGRSVPPRLLPYRMLEPVGIGLILLSVTPAAFLLMRLARGARERRRTAARRSSRETRQAAHAALDGMRAIDAADAGARRDGFARLDALVRQLVTDVCGVAAAGMTPDEIEVALESCAGRIPVELVTSILASCELARYASPELQPSPDTWREAVGQAEQILSVRRPSTALRAR
jgi:hypothetical protein